MNSMIKGDEHCCNCWGWYMSPYSIYVITRVFLFHFLDISTIPTKKDENSNYSSTWSSSKIFRVGYVGAWLLVSSLLQIWCSPLRETAAELVDQSLAVLRVGRARRGFWHCGDGSPFHGGRHCQPMHPRHPSVLRQVQRDWQMLLQTLYRFDFYWSKRELNYDGISI